MRVVLDTNVIIAGIFWQGPSSELLQHCMNGDIELVVSEATMSELFRVLRDFKLQLSAERLEALKKDLLQSAIVVEPISHVHIVHDDPSDNKFIEAAITSSATYIITYDKHLLRLPDIGTPIITPESFLKKHK